VCSFSFVLLKLKEVQKYSLKVQSICVTDATDDDDDDDDDDDI